MSIMTSIGLIGIGYMIKDHYDKKTTNYPNYRPPSYNPYNNRHPATIKDYLKNVAMDKMDYLFYGKYHRRRGNDETIRPKPIESVEYIPRRYRDEFADPEFDTRDDAEKFIYQAKHHIDSYGIFTFYDYLEATNRKDEGMFTDMCYGWNDSTLFQYDDIYREEDPYTGNEYWTIDIPEPKKLKGN